jgi:hypothetical protein
MTARPYNNRPNFLGALDWHVGDDDIGARRRGGYAPQRRLGPGGGYHSPAGNRHNAAMDRANRAASFAMPDVAGVPSRDAALVPAGWSPMTFDAAAGVAFVTNTMQPQMPFRGQRLTTFVLRNGTTALVSAPLVAFLQVGMKPIIATTNPIALETFNQNAYDTNLLMPPTVPGVVYSISVGLANALTSPDTILAIITIIGSGVL